MAKLNIRDRNKGQCYKNGKLKPPNWEYRFEGAKVAGKRRPVSKAGFRTKKEAEIAGAKALAEYNSTGLKFAPSEMSFADYLDYWYKNYVELSCRHSTQTAYEAIIRLHLKPALGQYRLKALTPIALQEYVNQMFVSGLKKSTLRNIMSVLACALDYAVLPAQLIPVNPAASIKFPKLSAERAEVNRTVISLEDFQRMLDRFGKGDPFRYALLIGFHTGLRIGEVHGLTWDDIDLKARTLSVNKLVYKRKQGGQSAWYFGDTKTSASVRTIKIGETLVKELREYRTMQLENQLAYGEYYTQILQKPEKDEKGNTIYRLMEAEKSLQVSLPEADLVMRKENGQYSNMDIFKYAARVIHYDLGIQFNFHSLRHTHATMMIEAGVSPKAVQARLGHENIQTTLQTYVHNTENMEDRAVDTFEKLVVKK